MLGRDKDLRRSGGWLRRRAKNAEKRGGGEGWPLSMRLMSWSEHDHFHLYEALTGIAVFGVTGSTKTTTTIEHLNRGFMLAQCGMILFCVKPDDPQNYLRQARECGREKDVILYGPAHGASFNFIEDGLGKGGPGLAANMTALLAIVSGLAGTGRSAASAGSGREDGSFWEKLDNRLIASSTQLLIRAGEPVTTINLERLVLSLPRSREQVADDAWRRSYLAACLQTADAAASSADDREDVARLADYFLVDLAQIGEKLRATVQTSVGATLDIFNHQITRRLLSSPVPTFKMETVQEGRILIVDMPTMTWGTLGIAVQKVLKYCFQQSQNRRDVSANPRPVAMVCDEAQVIADLENDAAFGCTARSTRTICLYATQSISNYLAQCPGQQGEARVASLLANLQSQVFHHSDTKTIEYAQSLFGKRTRYLLQGGSQQPSSDWVSSALGLGDGGSVSASYSEHLDYDLQAEHFQGLARGGPPDWVSEAILYQGGKHFVASGKPYLFIRMKQRPASL